MNKTKEELPSEKELLDSAVEFLTREYQRDFRFIRVDTWRECGESGLWLCVSELIDNLPEDFMDFELDQKVIENG